MKKALALVAAVAVSVITPLSASANTTPESYTPAHGAYRNVPTADRVYLETFGETGSEYDDRNMFYVPAGITCEYNSVTATGPFVVIDYAAQAANCTDASSNPYTIETNAGTGANALPFGFDINFYGAHYTKAWPNTNSGLMFDQPDNAYNNSMGANANDAGSSSMSALNADLGFLKGYSAFWTAQTTIDGHPAVVFSWDKNIPHGGSSSDNLTYQIVLISRGTNGDFDVEFNYDAAVGGSNSTGHEGHNVWVDLASDVTIGSNIINSADAASAFSDNSCVNMGYDDYGTATSSDYNNVRYMKKESATTVSAWSDDTCTTPVDFTALQNVSADGNAYVEYRYDSSIDDVAAGWSTYNPTTSEIKWFDFLRNTAWADALDGGAHPIIDGKLNSTVNGRYFFGQRGGATVTDSSQLGGGSTLANTGGDFTGLLAVASALVLGGALMAIRRRSVKN